MLLVMLMGLQVVDVRADTAPAERMFDTVSVYTGQGANHNLRELPGSIVSGNFDWEKSYFSALGLGKVRNTLEQSWGSLRDAPFSRLQQGYEVVLVQHRGLQHNEEAGAAYTLRTPDQNMGPLAVNFGTGVGLSYAIGNPSYEDGSKINPERRYRLQLLALFELEWHMREFENLSVITRVHHRSGVYGLIAPRHVGSNFLVAGARYKF